MPFPLLGTWRNWSGHCFAGISVKPHYVSSSWLRKAKLYVWFRVIWFFVSFLSYHRHQKAGLQQQGKLRFHKGKIKEQLSLLLRWAFLCLNFVILFFVIWQFNYTNIRWGWWLRKEVGISEAHVIRLLPILTKVILLNMINYFTSFTSSVKHEAVLWMLISL